MFGRPSGPRGLRRLKELVVLILNHEFLPEIFPGQKRLLGSACKTQSPCPASSAYLPARGGGLGGGAGGDWLVCSVESVLGTRNARLQPPG